VIWAHALGELDLGDWEGQTFLFIINEKANRELEVSNNLGEEGVEKALSAKGGGGWV